MQNEQQKKIKQILVLSFIFLVGFSFFFEIAESNHQCSEEKCQICLILQLTRNNLQLLTLFFFFLYILKKEFNSFFEKCFHLKNQITIKKTLVSQKIRLND